MGCRRLQLLNAPYPSAAHVKRSAQWSKITKTAPLLYWIGERERIRIRRANGEPPLGIRSRNPPEIQFLQCTARRRLDDPLDCSGVARAKRERSGLAVRYGRRSFCELVRALAELGYPVPLTRSFPAVMHSRKERGEVCFGPAYSISNGGSTTSKPEHLVQLVFTPLWGPLTRKRLRPRDDDSLLSF